MAAKSDLSRTIVPSSAPQAIVARVRANPHNRIVSAVTWREALPVEVSVTGGLSASGSWVRETALPQSEPDQSGNRSLQRRIARPPKCAVEVYGREMTLSRVRPDLQRVIRASRRRWHGRGALGSAPAPGRPGSPSRSESRFLGRRDRHRYRFRRGLQSRTGGDGQCRQPSRPVRAHAGWRSRGLRSW